MLDGTCAGHPDRARALAERCADLLARPASELEFEDGALILRQAAQGCPDRDGGFLDLLGRVGELACGVERDDAPATATAVDIGDNVLSDPVKPAGEDAATEAVEAGHCLNENLAGGIFGQLAAVQSQIAEAIDLLDVAFVEGAERLPVDSRGRDEDRILTTGVQTGRRWG
jgi:hypothetical protein